MSAVRIEYPSATCVRLTCNLKAPPQRAFDAWRNPEKLMQWFVPEPGSKCSAEAFDFQVGGRYALRIDTPDGCEGLSGSFLKIEPPRLIQMDWTCQHSTVDQGLSTVTVEFEPEGTGTKLTLTHDQLSGEASRDNHGIGWTNCLQAFENYIHIGKQA